jgi:hypothetical protein
MLWYTTLYRKDEYIGFTLYEHVSTIIRLEDTLSLLENS